ncbi:MAG TPA: hypothetical protein VHP37_27880 [Burkholderiales bacterium]|jgi:hypothetical protein|nr:hypothetical protein [Burkholderiales bacterium]
MAQSTDKDKEGGAAGQGAEAVSASVAGAAQGQEQPRSVSLGVRLVPVNNSDQPLFANYTTVNATPGVAFLDFAFLEPSVLLALPHVEKVPESINGRLVVRVALAPDALQNLARQLNSLLRPPQQS